MASSGQLSKRDLASIQNYLAKIKHKWIDIGVQLELDPDYLEELSSNSTASDGDNMRRMILRWLTRSYLVPKWQILCDALRTPAVDEADIADRIEEEKVMLMEQDTGREGLYQHIPMKEPTTVFVPTTTSMEAGEISASSESTTALLGGNEFEESEINVDPIVVCARDPFPHLITSGLLSKERDDILGKLIQDSMEIRFKFAELVTNLKTSLLRGNVDIEKLLAEVKYFGSYHQDAITVVGNIEGAVGAMNESWSFSEFSLLEHMLMKFGSNEDRAELHRYKHNLAEFSERKTNECPEGIFGGSTKEDEVVLMVKKSYTNSIIHDVTLSDVQNICSELRKEISVEDCNMRLIGTGVENQSLVLTFGIVSSVLQTVLSLLEDHSEKLTSLGIWYASCGEKVKIYAIVEDANDEVDGRMLETTEEVRGPTVLVLRSKIDHEDEDIGTHTSIAINNQKVVVEVSKSSSSSYKSYKIGKYRKGQLEWLSGMTGKRYGLGKSPKIALNNKGYVVEVDEEIHGNLTYRVGLAHYTNAILWSDSCVFTTGTCPSVALCRKTIIVTFKRSGSAFYQVGTLDVDNRLIRWSEQEHKFINRVFDLDVAVNHNCIVVAVYTKPLVTSTISPLYATIGELNRFQERILFSTARRLSENFSMGNFPSVALNRNNDIVVFSTRQKSVIQKIVEYKHGLIKKEHKSDDYFIKWSSDKGTLNGGGDQASVAISDKGVLLISHVSKGKYACHVGKLCCETE